VLHDAAVFLVLLCGITSVVTVIYYFKRRRFLGQLAQRVWAKRAKVAAAVNLLPVVPYNSSRTHLAARTMSSSRQVWLWRQTLAAVHLGTVGIFKISFWLLCVAAAKPMGKGPVFVHH
jgi:hypothetical protein